MMTTEMAFIVFNKMTMYMMGMTGDMAYRGNPDELKDIKGEDPKTSKVELIIGIPCKKAIISDGENYIMTYWYTEEFKPPEGMEQMPSDIYGLRLEFEVLTEGIKMTYTASAFKDDANMAEYALTIPEGEEVQSFDTMKAMGKIGN